MRRGTEENERLRRHIYKECVSHKVEHVREQIIALLPRLRRFARTMTRNVHDADDLVQTAIERALARFEQLRPNSSIAGWMFGIMRNAWIDEVRARVRRDRILAPEAAHAVQIRRVPCIGILAWVVPQSSKSRIHTHHAHARAK